MDFHSVMETFAEAWVAANTHTPLTEAAEQGLINNGPNSNSTGSPPAAHNQSLSTNYPPTAHSVPLNILHDSSNERRDSASAPPSTICPPLVTLQDVSNDRRDIDSLTDGDSCKLSGRQSPTDSHSNCTTLSELKSPYKTLSNPHGKSLPVHCIIEQIPGPQACGQYVELDSYAIVPDNTLFSDLIRTSLGKLGYSGAQILGAKGALQIKKWKPLAFDQITDNPEATVGDILGELTTVASLHIRLYSVPDDPQQWIDTTVRNAVLELLREMSQSKLAKICPLSQPMLSNIINNRYLGKIGKEKCQEFGKWYLSYRKEHPEGSTPEVIPNERPSDGRLTFHPSKELPLMRDWFHGCRNPSRRTLQLYVDILNQGPVRQQERPKISLSTLKNWWKNEKQRERKNKNADEESVDAPKMKRKKRTVNNNNNSNTNCNKNSCCGDVDSIKVQTVANTVQQFSGSNSQDSNPKTNKFTLIDHAETDDSRDGHFTIQKYTIRKETDTSRLNGNSMHQDTTSLFHKLPVVCLDNSNHSLFGFSHSHLSEPNRVKVYCDDPHCIPRTSVIDGNARMSSEDDVDVGI